MVEGEDFWRLPKKHLKFFPEQKYQVLKEYKFVWYNGKKITLYEYTYSDGATYATDLIPLAFFIHDQICRVPYFDDGTYIPSWLASRIYRKILQWHGVHIRSKIRSAATWTWGILAGTWAWWKK